MDKPAVRVLLIEDDHDDYLLTRDLLEGIPGNSLHMDWAQGYDAGLEALQRRQHDVCLLDYRLGARNGLALLVEATAKGCKTATILLTGQNGGDLDFAAMQAGATDFLEKRQLNAAVLERSIRYALQHQRDQQELEKRVEERTAELAQAIAALKETDRRKSEFLAMLAHELRNPLAPIRNALQIVRLTQGDAKAVKSASEMMERQIGHMVRLVDDLLDVSRISRGKIELRREPVELASLINQAVEACRPLVACANHELSVTLPPQPVYLHADPMRLIQVLGNLINNACKFMEPGGHVSLTAERQNGEVVISIRDRGIGISTHTLPRIFEMFMQGDQSLERSHGGLGIGLSLVKNLVEMHGGSVSAFSEGLGTGSEFVVRLPILIENIQPPPERTYNEPPTATARRILVVDDNQDSATSLAMLLELTGNETHTAYDGLEAVEAAARLQPDVVLLDIGLPKLNGYDAARKMREQSWGKSILLVALTGWGQEEDRQKSSEAGFNAHMVKPVDHAALLKLLDELQPTPRSVN